MDASHDPFGETDAAELERLFRVQRQASRTDPAPDAALRRDRLQRLRALLREHEAAIVAAVSADFGNRPAPETRLMEIVPVLNAVRHARRHLGRWMRPERRPVDIAFQPARAWVRHEPLGVVGIVAPWNYPVLLALSPLVDALAAGNRALLKPSELTPRFSALLARLVAAAYDEAEVAVVTGGPEVAERFTALPFDHLLFTGSTAVGRKVMRAAAENLTPVTLELGGKSPAIVAADYDIASAARSVAFGKFLNAGQTCIAPDYALVPEDSVQAFAEAVMAEVRRAWPTVAGNADYASIISARHYERLAGAVEAARAAGAQVLTHGGAVAAERRLGPTVVVGAPEDGVLMTEEIFGPVLPVVGYGSLEAAMAFVNARDRPLALYCFSGARAVRERVLDGCISGGATMNGTLLHVAQDALPFGGVGASGMGAYHGRDGFLRLSHARAVHRVGFVNLLERLGPPWGRLARRVGDVLARR